MSGLFFNFYSHPRTCLLILERGERRGKGGRETLISCLSNVPPLGTKPTTQASALTRNWTRDFSIYGVMLQPTEPHWPGQYQDFFADPWSVMPRSSWHVLSWLYVPKGKNVIYIGSSTTDPDKSPNCATFQEVWWNLEDALKLHFSNKYLWLCPKQLCARPWVIN